MGEKALTNCIHRRQCTEITDSDLLPAETFFNKKIKKTQSHVIYNTVCCCKIKRLLFAAISLACASFPSGKYGKYKGWVGGVL